MAKQCLIFWGNYEVEGGGQFSLQPGAVPSRGTLRFRLGYKLQQFADLRITDGTQTRVFSNCRLIRSTITSGSGGRMQEVVFEDWRWRWRYARVWAEANVDYNQGGWLYQRSAFQLGTMVMQALGVTRYDISALPSDDYPEVDWSAEPADNALAHLASLYGLVIVPRFNGSIVLVPQGVGRRPPSDDRAMDFTAASEPQVVPDALVFEGDQTHWQHDLLLEAVGFESFANGSAIKPIDQLSYKPAAGWEKQDPRSFLDVSAQYRELARSCVWKMYRIAENVQLTIPPSALPNGGNGGFLSTKAKKQIANYYKVSSGERWRILPLNRHQLKITAASGSVDDRAAVVFGYYRNEKHGTTNNKSDAVINADFANITNASYNYPNSLDQEMILHEPFEIDASTGIVTFANPVFVFGRNANVNVRRVPAFIRLRTSFPLRDPVTSATLSQQYWYYLTRHSQQGIVDVIKRDDINFEISPYQTTNVQDYTIAAQLSINARLTQYATDDSYTVPYKGFVFDCELDGAIACVTWNVSQRGEGTTSIDYLSDRADQRISTDMLHARMATINSVIAAAKAKRAQRRAQRRQGKGKV